jgi:hypothetical protein
MERMNKVRKDHVKLKTLRGWIRITRKVLLLLYSSGGTTMPWIPLQGSKRSDADLPDLPAKRGRFLLLLGEPFLNSPRWCHFSWVEASFAIRDYLKGRMMRQEEGITASDVWRAAKKRIPATGHYYHTANDVEWWVKELKKLEG